MQIINNDAVCKLPYILFLFVLFAFGPFFIIYVYVSIVNPSMEHNTLDSLIIIAPWLLLCAGQMFNFWLGWKMLHYAEQIKMDHGVSIRYYLLPVHAFSSEDWSKLTIYDISLPEFSCGKNNNRSNGMKVICCNDEKIIVTSEMANKVLAQLKDLE